MFHRNSNIEAITWLSLRFLFITFNGNHECQELYQKSEVTGCLAL